MKPKLSVVSGEVVSSELVKNDGFFDGLPLYSGKAKKSHINFVPKTSEAEKLQQLAARKAKLDKQMQKVREQAAEKESKQKAKEAALQQQIFAFQEE